MALVPVTGAWGWLGRPGRRHTLRPLAVALLAAVVLFPLDGWLGGKINSLDERSREGGRLLGGDVIRELAAVQQFGGVTSILLVVLLVWLLDPARRPRTLDLVAASLLTSLVSLVGKIVIGRPRPKFEDPWTVLGPFGAYNLGPEVGPRYAWELWAGISSDLWSMPSSHTSAAAALAVSIALIYPRLRALVLTLAVVVGFSRVLFGAHWPSDVAVGFGVGYAVAHTVVTRRWGQRLAARLGPTRQPRNAGPAG